MNSKVLIIEDEVFIREAYKEAFEFNGYTVMMAVNGYGALEMMNMHSFDTIIMDLMIPDLDGVSVLREMKKNPPKHEQGYVIITTNMEAQDNDELKDLYAEYEHNPLNLNVVSHLQKVNTSPADLVSRVKHLQFYEETVTV